MDTMINFTPAKLAVLKRAYGQAVREQQATLRFEGQELLVAYASYLIKYLQREFAQKEVML